MNKDLLLGIVRHTLTTLGGALAAKGVIDSGTMEAIVGGIVAALGFFLSYKKNKPGDDAPGGPPSIAGTLQVLVLGLALLGATGCATFKQDAASNAQRIKVAAYLGTYEALHARAEWRPQFQLVAANLRTIEDADVIDFTTVLAVLQTLPIKELKGERTVVYVTAAAMLLDDTRLRVKNTDEARTVVRALREGLELGMR
jgi:hypothetical protein